MVQAFVPKGKLTSYMGEPDLSSVGLSSLFGAISSSCSFAALATARSLFQKGAHFVATVAFMFASTNLVMELGILIVIFLGWQFLAAEVFGGIVLIAVSSVLIRLTYPKKWIEDARDRVDGQSNDIEEDFDPRDRVSSREGWQLVGHRFVGEWQMVWHEILIGFTVAGFMAVLVPASFWSTLFLVGSDAPEWLRVIENALIAPFVAAATFIGSMGNIPLATVLNTNGVMFVGIMGFIYSDLVVPPLVRINAKYYGWRIGLYIAGIMYVSIVTTALVLHVGFAAVGLTPQSARTVTDITRFKIDYTFWINLVFAVVAAVLIWLHRRHSSEHDVGTTSDTGRLKMAFTAVFLVVLGGGLAAFLIV